MLSLLRNEKAMTLIELLVACVIIGIAFVGLMGVFPLGMKNLSQSRMRTVATDLAQQKMEELLRLNPADGDLTAGTHNDPDNPVKTNFSRYWTVTADTPVAGMVKILVRVTYPHGTTVRDVQIQTYMNT
jgi:prepilin-type N-terminal cleavage/methylation domain-containing protein